mgnify:CR=1 FL=1
MPHMFDPTLLVAELARRKETVALCESLTGGLASAMLVDVPGASAVFNGALVTYATPMKHRLAGVPCEVLESVGPVCHTRPSSWISSLGAPTWRDGTTERY